MLAALLLLSACSNLGPRAVQAGRGDYDQVLRDTNDEQGLVNVTRHADGAPFDWAAMTDGLMQIRASDAYPQQAAVRVRDRGHWYYIDDADLDSKSTFSLLVQLFALQAGGSEGARPVLTLPVGG